MIHCVFIGFLLGLCWCSSGVEGKDSCDLMTNDTACIVSNTVLKNLRYSLYLSSQSGVEFLLRGDSIPTDGLLITDISLYNGQNSTDEDALFCHST